MFNSSLERYDSPLKGKPTLPSVGQPTVIGGLLKVARTLNPSICRDFGWSARPLARLRLGAN